MLKYFVLTDDKVIDQRRVQSIAPSAQVIATACKDIKLPNGDALAFITDLTTFGATVKRDVCFQQVVTGTVVRQDFVKFEASILSATLEADASLDAGKTSVTVISSEEQVAADGYVIQILILLSSNLIHIVAVTGC